jgi:hypothetical protein
MLTFYMFSVFRPIFKSSYQCFQNFVPGVSIYLAQVHAELYNKNEKQSKIDVSVGIETESQIFAFYIKIIVFGVSSHIQVVVSMLSEFCSGGFYLPCASTCRVV